MSKTTRRALVGTTIVVAVLAALPVVYLATLDPASLRGPAERFLRGALGRDVTVGGIDLVPGLAPRISMRGVVIAGAAGPGAPPAVTLERLEATVALLPLLTERAIEISGVLAEGLRVSLPEAGPGHASPRGGPNRPTPESSSFRSKLVDLRVRDAEIVYASERMSTALRLRIDDAAVTGSPKSPGRRVAGRGEIAGIAVSFEAEATRAERLFRGGGGAIEASLAFAGTRARLAGTVRHGDAGGPTFEGRVTVSVAGPESPLAPHFVIPALPLDLQAEVSGGASGLVADRVRLTLAGQRIEGRLQVDVADRWRVSGVLGADRFDAASLRVAGPGDAARTRLLPAIPLSLTGLGGFDAALDVEVGRLALGGAVFEALRLPVRLDGGRLHLGPFRAVIAAGTLTGRIELASVDGATRVALDATVDGARAEALLAAFAGDAILEGPVHATARLTGSGQTTVEVLAGASGELRVLVGEGRMRATTLDRLVGGLGALVSTLGRERTDWAKLNCLAADLDVSSGLASARVMLLDSEFATVTGTGSIDLAPERVDLVLSPRSKSATLNLALPVRVGGTLLEPSFAPEEGAAALKLAGILGTALFPPAALAAFADLGTGEARPCLVRLAAGDERPAVTTDPQRRSMAETAAEASKMVGETVKGAVEGLGRSIGRLFGN